MKRRSTVGLTSAVRKFFDKGGPPYTYSISRVMEEINAKKIGWSRDDVGRTLAHLAQAGVLQRNGAGRYCRFCDPARGDVLPITPQPEPARPALPLTYSVETSSDGEHWVERRTGLGSEAAAVSFMQEYVENFALCGRVVDSGGALLHKRERPAVAPCRAPQPKVAQALFERAVAAPAPPMSSFGELLQSAVESIPKKVDAWVGANPVVGTEAHTLVNATSEALCREVVWRLVQQRLPDECARALLTALLATAQKKET